MAYNFNGWTHIGAWATIGMNTLPLVLFVLFFFFLALFCTTLLPYSTLTVNGMTLFILHKAWLKHVGWLQFVRKCTHATGKDVKAGVHIETRYDAMPILEMDVTKHLFSLSSQ